MKKLTFFPITLAEAGVVVLSAKPMSASVESGSPEPVALPHHGAITRIDVTNGVLCAVNSLPDGTINARHIMLRTFVATS